MVEVSKDYITVSGCDEAEVVSDRNLVSVFLCAICERTVTLDAVVSNCCSQPYCSMCLQVFLMECATHNMLCRCSACDMNLQSEPTTSTGAKKSGLHQLAVTPLHVSQPLSFKVLSVLQIKCRHKSCSWIGNYDDFIVHMHMHNNKIESLVSRNECVNSILVGQGNQNKCNTSIGNYLDRKNKNHSKENIDHDVQKIVDLQDVAKLVVDCNTNYMSPKRPVSSVQMHIALDDPILLDERSDQSSLTGFDDSEYDDEQLAGSENVKLSIEQAEQALFRKVEKVKKKANAKFNKGNFMESRDLYTDGIKLLDSVAPRNASEFKLLSDMYSNRSVTFFRYKEFDECIKDCECAIEYDQTVAKPWIRKMRALLGKGKFEESHDLIKQASMEIPDSFKIQEEVDRSKFEMDLYLQLKLCINTHDYESAENLFHDSIDDCENIVLLSKYAKVLQEMGKYDEAIIYTEKCIEINPRYIEALEICGLCYFYSGKIDQGLHVLSEAYEANKDSLELKQAMETVLQTNDLYEKANSSIQQNNYNEAYELLNAAMQICDPLPPVSPIFLKLKTDQAKSALLSCQYVSALQACQDVINVHREYAPIWIIRAEILMALGKGNDAKRELMHISKNWGIDDVDINNAYQRIDSELRIWKVHADILKLQNELDNGICESLLNLDMSELTSRKNRKDKRDHSTDKAPTKKNDSLVRASSFGDTHDSNAKLKNYTNEKPVPMYRKLRRQTSSMSKCADDDTDKSLHFDESFEIPEPCTRKPRRQLSCGSKSDPAIDMERGNQSIVLIEGQERHDTAHRKPRRRMSISRKLDLSSSRLDHETDMEHSHQSLVFDEGHDKRDMIHRKPRRRMSIGKKLDHESDDDHCTKSHQTHENIDRHEMLHRKPRRRSSITGSGRKSDHEHEIEHSTRSNQSDDSSSKYDTLYRKPDENNGHKFTEYYRTQDLEAHNIVHRLPRRRMSIGGKCDIETEMENEGLLPRHRESKICRENGETGAELFKSFCGLTTTTDDHKSHSPLQGIRPKWFRGLTRSKSSESHILPRSSVH